MEVIIELLSSIIPLCSINKIKQENFDYGMRQGVIVEPNVSNTFKELNKEKKQMEAGLLAWCFSGEFKDDEKELFELMLNTLDREGIVESMPQDF